MILNLTNCAIVDATVDILICSSRVAPSLVIELLVDASSKTIFKNIDNFLDTQFTAVLKKPSNFEEVEKHVLRKNVCCTSQAHSVK